MKKLLLLLFLMTISLGYSQTLTGTWKMSPQAGAFLVGPGQGSNGYFQNSAGDVTTRACFFDDQFVFNADGSFQNVNGSQTWVEGWQGGGDDGCRASVAPHDGSNAATYTYDSAAGTLTVTGIGAYLGLAKAVNGGELSNGAAMPSSRTYIVTSLTSTLLTLDINVGGGTWWRFILAKEGSLPTCTDGIQNGTETGIDCGGTCSACPDPTPPASNPTIAAANAITIYSDSGTLAGTAVPVDTFRTVWSPANLDNVVLSGNAALKYTNLGYVGIETVNNQINATGMNLFHIDVYTATATTFAVKLVDFGANGGYQGGDDAEHQVALTTQVGWNSYNILLSDFTGLTTRAHIAQIILVGSGTAYVDNMYFGNVVVQVAPVLSNFTVPTKQIGDAAFTITAPTSTSSGSFTYTSSNTNVATISGSTITIVGVGTSTITATQAASGNYLSGSISATFTVTPEIQTVPTAGLTPPARNAWDVKSLYSGAPYTNEPSVIFDIFGDGASSIADFTLNDGNVVAKYLGHRFSGIRAGAGDLNVTSMTKLHLDVYSPDPSFVSSFRIKLEAVNGSNVELDAPASPTRTNGNWISYDIDLSAYSAVDLTHLKWVVPVSTATWPVGITMYIDNVYFWRPATTQPSPTITNFTVPNKFIGDGPFQLTAPTSNSTGAFTYTVTGASGVATISGDTVTIVGGGSTIITATQAAAGGYTSGVITASFVVSFPPPATAAPTPTLPADRVLSVFSDAYTNEGGAYYPYWGQPGAYIAPAVVAVGSPSSNTLKIDNLTYQGVQLTNNIDVSSMTTLHLDIWTPNCTTFDFYLIDSAPVGVQPAEQKVTVSPTQSGWNSIDISMSSYDLLALTDVQQFKFVGAPAGSIVYIDNIYFTKPTPRSPITSTVVNYCKGAVPSALTATAFAGNTLKWYTGTTNATTGVTTFGTASNTAPTPVTSTVGTKKYAVSQVSSSDGLESDKAIITVNTIALPTEVLGSITSNTVSTVTPGTYLAATTAVGQFVGTSNTVSYRITPFVGSDLTYVWNVPSGVNIVSQNANVLTVNFLNVTPGVGAIGNITVQAQNANGCRTAAKTLAVSKVLPTAPASIKMTDASLPIPTTGIPTAVTSFGQYMGTTKVLTLTATPSTTATSYEWELPVGVNQLSGGNSNEITVNFLGVTSSNTHNYMSTAAVPVSTNSLRIGVKSINGVGTSTTSNSTLINPQTSSTARLLTLTAVAPAAPTLKMTNDAVSTATAVTVLSKFIGTTTEFTLTATAVATASSYEWSLPSGVNVTFGNPATDRIIKVNFAGVSTGVTTLYIGSRAKNGVGTSNSSALNAAAPAPYTSSTYKLLKLTAAVPAAVSIVTGQIGGVCGGSTYEYTISVATTSVANSYVITAPTGSVVKSASNLSNTSNVLATSDLTFTVTYPAGFVGNTTLSPKTVAITSVNGVGNSLTNKSLVITTAMPTIGTATGSAGITTFSRCDTQSFVVPTVLGATNYVWTVANGATIIDGQGTNAIEVDFSLVPSSITSTKITVLATNACGVNTTLKTITLASAACKSLKADAALVDNTISIYPNPARDNFTVALNASEVSEMSMTIYNINGAMIRTKNVQLTEGNNMINEDISSLASGIYFVQIYSSSNQETIVKKLVKE